MKPWVPYVLAAGAGVGLALVIQRVATPSKPGPIITIVMENKSRSQLSDAPNFTAFANANVDLANYRGTVQPSLPAYIQMVMGTTAGITDDTGFVIPGTDNLAAQMDAAGIVWRSYTGGTTSPCDTRYHGTYMPRHVPWLYLENVVGRVDYCSEHVVPLEPYFWDDLARGDVQYMFVTPDACDDMHDCGIAHGDAWLGEFLPRILSSPAYRNGGVLFILFDERGSGSSELPAILASPRLRTPGVPFNGLLGHKSYLATVEDLMGLPRLPTVATEPSMAGLLGR